MEPDAAVPATLADIALRLAAERLEVLGGFACAEDEPGLPGGTRTVLMVGPGAGFWPHLTAAAEWQDGAPDPVDRWSRRVVGRIACDLGAKALFPFGGPPWHPFQTWAMRTGRVWESPVRLLVHDAQGLWVSFRGALALKAAIDLPPPPAAAPCETCAGRPCLTACPPGALTGAGYGLAECHGFLDRRAGADCMGRGCAVRRACPVSQLYDRMPEQSAYHMGQFHRGGR
ncbi:MAG: ferredoxin [Paracoccaceae bacterium]|nr:MAG: ferredoxin [Paracoccaceae bacterium]